VCDGSLPAPKAGYIEHGSAHLTPGEHYLPIDYDLANLVPTIRWLQQNDGVARAMARRLQALARRRLRFEDQVRACCRCQ